MDMEGKKKIKRRHVSSARFIAGGFLGVIAIGCLLLMVPAATINKKGAPFLDALFTATSAVCVTGLVVHDTATYWTVFGKTVILLLIQIGGMGVITIAVAMAIFSGRKIGLMQRSTMQESISAPNMAGIVRLTYFILKVTLGTELIGAVLTAPVFCREMGFVKGCGYALFHSISAFCNAGFDLMGIREQYSSLTAFSAQPLINLVIMLLIIWGGIGFLTWDDIRKHKWHIKKYRMQSKVILTTTFILLVLPAIYFYFVEFSREVWDDLPAGEHILVSLFQAVTPRTAGFNTADLSKMCESSKLLTIILMLIGGSPGSTAGGMKTTTFAVLMASAIAVFRRNEDVHCYGRRISPEVVRSAAAVLIMYVVLFLSGGMVISIIEDLPVLECLFESASAIGTVGLTLGLTPGLGTVSRIILIGLMYLGRVGGMTIVFAATANRRPEVARFPLEKITVG